MSTRLGVLPYGPSDSCRELKNALATAFIGTTSVIPRLIKVENSAFRGRASDIIINYGNRSAPEAVFGQATVLNPQASLNRAANKLTALNVMQAAGVSVIPFTTDPTVARGWVQSGETVYQRNTLTGHSGEGIVTIEGNNGETVSTAPLYTKGITGQRREWRVHIFKGVITYVQVKRRANGYQENAEYREDVRNHHTGWIYATENINPSAAVLTNAVLAVQALGLDFGAVDIISRRDEAWVLEVNTAPGLSGTTLETFTRNVVEYTNATRERRPAVYVERFPVPTAPVEPVLPEAPSATPTGRRGGEVDAIIAHQAAQAASSRPSTRRSVENIPTQNDDTNLSFSETPQTTAGSPSTVYPDGYYCAVVQNQDGNVSQKAILWVSNGRFYRHGWNHPISQGSLRSISPVTHITVQGLSEPVSLSFATQE